MTMTITDRIDYFESLFDDLTLTNSLNDKRDIVAMIPIELLEDFNYIVECLNGIQKFGYTYNRTCHDEPNFGEFNTVKELLQYMQEPYTKGDLSQSNIYHHCYETCAYEDFLEPIINRTLKLGIGRSLLSKIDTSPMLAKKFEPDKTRLIDRNGVYITQKLDGNRCIAKYDGTKWHFLSRSGKEMYVDFDMRGLPTEYIYDGEILSPSQTLQSTLLLTGRIVNSENTFNLTSGVINRHTKDKKLVYNIFDIIEPKQMYCERREILTQIEESLLGVDCDVRILPVLRQYNGFADANDVAKLLDQVTGEGAEGLMINFGSGTYENKRTDKLLKFKKMKTIDMRVVEVIEGNGKYEGQVGSLYCECTTDDGKHVTSYVGSGLSDLQRINWSYYADELIIGKIVEIGYFEMSQNSNERGTNNYSLRFPRLLKVRGDKNTTSEY